MNKLNYLLCYLITSLVLGGCARVEKIDNIPYSQSAELNKRAAIAYQQGDYASALLDYQQALAWAQSIEHLDSIAISLINLAKVQQMMGDLLKSHQYLDKLLSEKTLHYQPIHLASAATQKALLFLSVNQLDDAKQWLQQATQFCLPNCTLNGVIANVQASIALRGGNADQALIWANKGLAENKHGEYANSLRLAGHAYRLKKQYANALKFLNDALALDKSLGLSEKIQIDLNQLADTYQAMQEYSLAEQYRDRAKRISMRD